MHGKVYFSMHQNLKTDVALLKQNFQTFQVFLEKAFSVKNARRQP